MPKRKRSNILFPTGGLYRQGTYRQQPPFTSPDLENVRAIESIEGRGRGGSRPGLVKSHITDLGSNVRMLYPMVVNLDNFKTFSDTFSGTALMDAWSQASWSENVPSILPEALASIDTSIGEGDIVLDALPIDTTEIYYVEIDVIQWADEYNGEYRLYFRLDDTTPDITQDGVEVILTSTGSTGAYEVELNSYTGGVKTVTDSGSGTISAAIPSWLTAVVNGNIVTVYWNGVNIASGTVDAHTGTRVGFGMECTEEDGVCLVNVFRVQYYTTESISGSRTLLVASSGGDLFYEQYYGAMTALASDLTFNDSVVLTAAQSGQNLYIADYGDLRDTGTDGAVSGSDLDDGGGQNWTTLGIDTDSDVCVISNVGGATVAGTYTIASVQATEITLGSAPGDGTCSYRIERAPKVYDPSAGTLAIWTATTGQVPTGNPIVTRYMDRMVLAGADIAPHVWYMSRQGDPDDWDYSEEDSQAAVAGTASEAGVPGTAILALAPYSDDYLIIGCRSELWRMRGDPGFGGVLDNVSRVVGIIGRNAWTFGPEGELIFLSLNGLYVLPPSGESVPIAVSRNFLPEEFKNIDPNSTTTSLEYDSADNGVHIFLTADSPNERNHWWFDWQSKTFWKVTVESDYEPLSACLYPSFAIEDAGAIFGCRDGYIRRFSKFAERDDGTAYSSYVIIGPLGLADDGIAGSLISLYSVMANDSGDVTWSTHPSNTFESSVTASQSDTGTWTEGLNARNYASCKGQAYTIKITGTSGRKWAMENIIAETREAGRLRIS